MKKLIIAFVALASLSAMAADISIQKSLIGNGNSCEQANQDLAAKINAMSATNDVIQVRLQPCKSMEIHHGRGEVMFRGRFSQDASLDIKVDSVVGTY